jgi:hypothetical protein
MIRGAVASQTLNVDDEAARRSLHPRVAKGLDGRRAEARRVFEPEPFGDREQLAPKLARVRSPLLRRLR